MTIRTAIFFLLSALITGCGYFVPEELRNRDALPKPDLIIADIQWELLLIDHTQEIWCDGAAPDSPTQTLRFHFTVVNTGQAPFHGELLFARAVGESDIAWGAYSRAESPSPNAFSIMPHDTARVSMDFESDINTFLNNRVKFIIVTQQVMPQSKMFFNDVENIPESNLDNNSCDLYLEY
jgi:hypothetical protein